MRTLVVKQIYWSAQKLLAEAYYAERDETNEHEKQVIPYVLIRSGDGWLGYTRFETEKRLLGQRSYGFGGHVEDNESVLDCAVREVQEETGIVTTPDMYKLLGVIYDNSTPVNRVHVGIVYLLDLRGYPKRTLSAYALDAKNWQKYSEIGEVELWTELAFDLFFKRHVTSRDITLDQCIGESLRKSLFNITKVSLLRYMHNYVPAADWPELCFSAEKIILVSKDRASCIVFDSEFKAIENPTGVDFTPLREEILSVVKRELYDDL